MTKLKEGDRCEIIVIGKSDYYYKNNRRKELIGKKFCFIERRGGYRGGGFIGCELKSEIEIKLPGELISKNKPILFFMVKPKKI